METSVNKSRLITLIAFSAIILSCIFWSCESFFAGKEKPSKNLTIEDEVDVASESVSSSGGTIVVDSPGSEIDGMEIMVPEGSYSNSRTFKITTAAITNHNLGEYFNPITPLIQIENGSGYADSIMEVTIPISIEDGEIPLGFYYDEITGKLEAIPVKSYTKNSITLLTRHFMPASELRGDDEGLKGVKIDATSNMLISSLQESVLNRQNIISSGFKPGVDDWEFVNYGSYLSPGGHCAGQSMTSMWYYYEEKLKGEQALFHRFDEINDKTQPGVMWFDNGVGYRFASVIQNDFNFDGWISSLNMQSYIPSLVFKYFAAAIYVTGEPQSVLINSSAGKGGHAMIVYKVNLSEEKLYIADPNYPNNIDPDSGAESVRVIELIGGKLKPYETGLTAGASSITMDQIGFAGKTAYIEWPQIGKRYKELLDSTIGTKAPNTFPEYTIWAKGEKDIKLKDGFTSDKDTLRCEVECPTASRGFVRNGKVFLNSTWYNDKGQKIDISEGSGKRYTLLKPGLNKIGIYVYAQKTGVVDQNGNFTDTYIDFKWYNVYYSKLKIDPNPIVGEPNEDIEITAMSFKTAPSNAKYVWNFGDGTKEIITKNDSIVKHKFPKEGDFEVTVDLYDNSNDKLVGHAVAEANIANGILSRLQKYQWVEIMFSAEEQNTNNEFIDFSVLWLDNSPPWGVKTGYPIKWNGASFSVSYDYNYTDIEGESSYNKGSYSATLSANGLVIKSFQATETSSNNLLGGTDYDEIAVTDIPYNPDYEYDDYNPRFELRGSKIASHVSSYSQKLVDAETSIVSTTIEYSEDEESNYIIITFSGEK